MGTDVYMEWDEKTSEDQENQNTGWSIEAGNVGYLRASIGMAEENAVLRLLFPDSIWESKKENGEKYDFIKHFSMLPNILKEYVEGNEIDVGDRLDSQNQRKQAVYQMLKGLNVGQSKIDAPKIDKEDVENRLIWAKSLAEFFEFGCKLQKQGQKPRVYISW